MFGIFTEAGGWECTSRGRSVKGWDKKKKWMKKRKKDLRLERARAEWSSLSAPPRPALPRSSPVCLRHSGHIWPSHTDGFISLGDIRLDKFHNILAPTVRGEGDKTRSAPFHLPLPVSSGRGGGKGGGGGVCGADAA